jgi:RNA polymerase-interacting CarD/CdnL/TRCF family regulator
MQFHEGDTVMHWTYGLGQILGVEERDMFGSKNIYYAVRVHDLTVWVPTDAELQHRLRPPTSKAGFQELIAILSNPVEPLPDDRKERRTRLLETIGESSTQSLCRIIAGLHAYQKIRPLNDSDKNILKQSRNALLGEWEYVFSITADQAEHELSHLLVAGPLPVAE